jgi:NADH-quinone oxidoreductase subunit J
VSFWAGGLIAVTAGLLSVTRRNAVASVLWLVASFLGMSILFVGMDAGFIGIVQILVYAGAIMVLFLFVIMFLNLTPSGLLRIDRPRLKLVGVTAALALVAIVVALTMSSEAWTRGGTRAAIEARSPDGKVLEGTALALADRMFAEGHLLPFEAASVLLLVAIVGAVALTKRKV